MDAAANESLEARRYDGPASHYGRFDDTDLDLVMESTILCGTRFNEYETSVNGNLLFNPSGSLRTVDWHRFGTLLEHCPDGEGDTAPRNFRVVHEGQRGGFVATVDNVLSSREMDEILSREERPQHFHNHRSDRVIVIDEAFAQMLWRRLQPFLHQFVPRGHVRPLGFGVSGVQWQLEKVNPAIRINSYGSGQRFAPHRDAQFAESRKSRSVLSAVIFLKGVEEGGETRFTVGRTGEDLPSEPMTVEEEVKYLEGHGGVETFSVEPVRGRCLLFTHDLLHESLPAFRQDRGGASEGQSVDLADGANLDESEFFLSQKSPPDYSDPSFYACLPSMPADELERGVAEFRAHPNAIQELRARRVGLGINDFSFEKSEHLTRRGVGLGTDDIDAKTVVERFWQADYFVKKRNEAKQEVERRGRALRDTAPDYRTAAKVVLRTDIVAACSGTPMFVTQTEVRDYRRSLELFYEAEQTELEMSAKRPRALFKFAAKFNEGLFRDYETEWESDDETQQKYPSEFSITRHTTFLSKLCDEYYSKSLYLRYRYPKALENQERPLEASSNAAFQFLGNITVHVMQFLHTSEVIQLSVVFPALKKYVHAAEHVANGEARLFCDKSQITFLQGLEEGIQHADGRPEESTASLKFRLRTDLDFCEHYKAWCRVAAVLVIYKVSHSFKSPGGHPWYCARFIPQTGEVLAVPLERLIYDAFNNTKCCGAVFAVEQQDSDADCEKDFNASVDRSVMLRDFQSEFTGQNLFQHVYAEVRGENARGESREELTRRINVVEPFVTGSCGGWGKQEPKHLPTRLKGPCRHIFASSYAAGEFEFSDHANTDIFTARLSRERENQSIQRKIVFNQCIFDFDRCSFNVREASTTNAAAPDQWYEVSITDLAREVEPFYHAAAYHSSADVELRKSVYEGGFRAFQRMVWRVGDVGDCTVHVKPQKVGENEWLVLVEWPVHAFPITL